MALRKNLGPASAFVEGELRSVRIEGVTWPVLVTRVDGEIVATSGVCPHEDVSLEHGELHDGCLTCPGHAYQFDLRTGACFHDRSLMLQRYRVTVIDGDVVIDLLLQ